jgi:hypothetical protein
MNAPLWTISECIQQEDGFFRVVVEVGGASACFTISPPAHALLTTGTCNFDDVDWRRMRAAAIERYARPWPHACPVVVWRVENTDRAGPENRIPTALGGLVHAFEHPDDAFLYGWVCQRANEAFSARIEAEVLASIPSDPALFAGWSRVSFPTQADEARALLFFAEEGFRLRPIVASRIDWEVPFRGARREIIVQRAAA